MTDCAHGSFPHIVPANKPPSLEHVPVQFGGPSKGESDHSVQVRKTHRRLRASAAREKQMARRMELNLEIKRLESIQRGLREAL